MRKTLGIRYVLFGLIFACVILGLVMKSYGLLVGLVVVGIILGIVADKIENGPTEPFKHHNQLHHHKH